MPFYFDNHGWLSDAPIAGRETNIAPPAGPYEQDHLPNFTGVEWFIVPYVPPRAEVPYVAPPPVRIVVSAWQIRKALNATGLRDGVEASVAASTSKDLKDAWAHAPYFYSDDPLALAMGYAMGKTPAEMYDLYQLAESL